MDQCSHELLAVTGQRQWRSYWPYRNPGPQFRHKVAAPPPCSWPSDQSEALVNGPKWFSIPQNHGLDTKLLSSMNWSKVTIYASFGPKYPFSANIRDFSRHSYMGVKDLLCKKLWVPLDQYIPEHLLKLLNYQRVEKYCLSPPSINSAQPGATYLKLDIGTGTAAVTHRTIWRLTSLTSEI